MQYIQNIVFWLTAAMDAATTAITLGIIVLLVCLFGIGLGVGRLWNAKWKLNASALGISAILGLLAAVLIMVHTAMGFVQDTIMAPRERKTMQANLCNDLANNKRLMDEAYKSGLKNLITTGENTDTLTETTQEFTFPGENDHAIKANKEKFVAGVIKAISGTATPSQKDKAKKKVETLSDMPPFSYGFAPISKDADGTIVAALEEELNNFDGKISCAEPNPFWYSIIAKNMVEQSFKSLEKGVCQKIDSQRTSALILMMVLMLLQVGIISWLAYSDIRPRRIQLD